MLIITVAGSSTRFSKSVGHEVLKCLYYKKDYTESLLYRMLKQPVDFDKYVIVGGYKYVELCAAVENWFPEMIDKIVLIENPYYVEYGSGYSLYYGIRESVKYDFDELTFAEGDLFVDSSSFTAVYNSSKSVITYNHDPILANKTVAFYFNLDEKVRYIYDTGHSALMIGEPFLSIYNSGQIWKMSSSKNVRQIYDGMKMDDWKGTNLVFIEAYFNTISSSEIEMIHFTDWINCNTVNDFECI